jgi:hypothetical protein
MMTNLIKDAMDDYWGERCPDYHGECICCQAWNQYDILTQAKAFQQITDSLKGFEEGENTEDIMNRMINQVGEHT